MSAIAIRARNPLLGFYYLSWYNSGSIRCSAAISSRIPQSTSHCSSASIPFVLPTSEGTHAQQTSNSLLFLHLRQLK
jgi:hypothetical protein